jgi:HK97 family phage portal protein
MGIVVDFLRAPGPKATPDKVPTSSATVAFRDRGRVGKTNVSVYRNWSERSEWVRTAINLLKREVSTAEWDITAFDTDQPASPALARQVKLLFDHPNARNDSFRGFLEPVIEDILTLDAGCIEQVRSLKLQTVELWPVNGGEIKIDALWDGSNPKAPRYYWYPDQQERAHFRNEEMVYMMANPATHRVVGLSPLEVLKMTIDAELSGSEYNRKQVISAAPDGILHLGEEARPEQVEQFRSYWQAEIAGKGAIAITGGTKNPAFIPFRSSNRDMQFLEWQIYLVRKIAAVFGLTPQDLGVTYDVNRSTSETQSEQTENRGVRPLMSLVQDYFTREIVQDPAFGGPENNLAFRFLTLNIKENTAKANINKLALASVPWKTVNEARIDDGREPLGPEYDQLMMVTPTGAVTLSDVPTAREWLTARTKPPPQARTGSS